MATTTTKKQGTAADNVACAVEEFVCAIIFFKVCLYLLNCYLLLHTSIAVVPMRRVGQSGETGPVLAERTSQIRDAYDDFNSQLPESIGNYRSTDLAEHHLKA